jgi:hypothetical protein
MIWFQMITLGGSSELDLLITWPIFRRCCFQCEAYKEKLEKHFQYILW